jgi:hypothetical protein
MSKNNDIKPPSNVKDVELFEQNIIQGVSLEKVECGGENLRKPLRYFSSKSVNRIYLLIGDSSWTFTYGMREIDKSEALGLKKSKVAEQVVELLDNLYLLKKFGGKARKQGDKWLNDLKNTNEYQEYSEVKVIRTSEIAEKYAEVFARVKDLLVKIYLSKSDNDWVIKFKQGIGENAREYCSRNEDSFKNQGLAFKLSLAHSLSEAILITTLAVAKNVKYFAYPDVNFHFIYPVKNLLLLEPEYKDLNILNSFCYKLPAANSLIGSPRKKEVLPRQEFIIPAQTQKTARRRLSFFEKDNTYQVQTTKSLESTEPVSPGIITKDYLDEVFTFLQKTDQSKLILLHAVLLQRFSSPIGYTTKEPDSVLSYEQIHSLLNQLGQNKNSNSSSSDTMGVEQNSEFEGSLQTPPNFSPRSNM